MAESWVCVYLTILCVTLENSLKNSACYVYVWPSSHICSFLRVISFVGIHLISVTFLIISLMRYFKIVHAVHRYTFQRSVLIFPSLVSVTASLIISGLLVFLENVEGTLLDPVCLLFFSWPQGPIFWGFYSYFLDVNCLITIGVIVLGSRIVSVIVESDKVISASMGSSIKRRKKVICARIILQCSSGLMPPVAASTFQLLSGHFTDYNWHVWFAITVVPISLLANFCIQTGFTPAFINDIMRTKQIFMKHCTSKPITLRLYRASCTEPVNHSK